MKHVYKKIVYSVLLLGGGLCWQGCHDSDRQAQTPTYVHIDSFSFNHVPPNITSTASHQITQVWAYYNNSLIGTFDLPATFPVITNGDTGKLELAPGIVVDGRNEELGAYPFYKLDTSSFRSVPGKVVSRQPATGFFNTVKVHTISDFEGGVGFVLHAGTIPMTTVSDDSLVFEGHSGSILLSAPTDTLSIDSTAMAFAIPAGTAFIEFNYKCDMPFFVALQANLGSMISSTIDYKAEVLRSDHWQKFYLNVANFTAQAQATTYNLYIKTSLPGTLARGRVLLDNIQLVTF